TMADLLSRAHRRLCPERQRAVLANLEVLRGVNSTDPRLAQEVFRHYGRTMFEFLRGPDIPEVELRFRGFEHLHAALDRGSGAILAALHTGNWVLGGVRLAARGVPVNAVAGVQMSEKWTGVVRRRHAAAGIRILPAGLSATREMIARLGRNETLVLLPDGDVFRKGVEVPLAGRSVPLPAGPARLAARTGAALLPVIPLRLPDGTHSLEFIEEIPIHGTSHAEIRCATTLLAARMEKALCEHANQWSIFRPFFEGRTAA
ncbi:MAG: lysophospholipid acyltransferase family protein, partial [Gemmatimonadota bacterium]|nr:lysophospholipid acyltransferase family protein [Gemmatimonadota bacterium]